MLPQRVMRFADKERSSDVIQFVNHIPQEAADINHVVTGTLRVLNEIAANSSAALEFYLLLSTPLRTRCFPLEHISTDLYERSK